MESFQSFYEKLESEEEKLEAIIHRCATDIQLFAILFFPHYCTRPFNAFHYEIFKTIKFRERDVRRARAAPRGAAKSTFATLIKPIHDVCYGLEKFILVISATAPLANKKLKNIRSEILFNRSLRDVFGVGFPGGKAGESEFLASSYMGETYFMAIGKGTAVRGVSWRESRPTKVICDDYETAEEVINEKIRQKDADRYFEDIGKAGDTGTNFEFVGTILHKDSLLSKLLVNPRYDSLPPYQSILSWSEREDLWNKWREIYRDIDNPSRQVDALRFFQEHEAEMLKGTVVMWPEKETYYDHMVDLEEIGRRAFMKEKQNDPQGADEPIFERFHWYREVSEGIQIESNGTIVKWEDLEAVGAMDPSTGQEKPKKGKLGDYTVIPSGYKDLKGRLFVHHDFTKRVPPTRYIQEIFELNDRFKYSKFAVETNLYRNLLLPNILDEQKRRQTDKGQTLKIPFYDVVQTENKHERIYRLEPKVNHGWILFNRALSREFMNMFIDFPYADHDDAPDAVEILWNLCNNRYRPSGLSLNAMAGR